MQEFILGFWLFFGKPGIFSFSFLELIWKACWQGLNKAIFTVTSRADLERNVFNILISVQFAQTEGK